MSEGEESLSSLKRCLLFCFSVVEGLRHNKVNRDAACHLMSRARYEAFPSLFRLCVKRL